VIGALERFLAFRRVPVKIVLVTALLSYVLQIGAILQGQPLYVIAIYTLLPWIPLLLFEGLWKFEHYSLFAIFALVTFLQVGHLGEHLFQVTQLTAMNGTFACPPPIDDAASAQRAVAAGMRTVGEPPTFQSASTVIKPGPTGQAMVNAQGDVVRGMPACGVFGQLDFETVHLVWDSLVWIGALFLVTRFPRNAWLWVAAIVASTHEVEHLFLGWIFFMEHDPVFTGNAQVWATTAVGQIVTAHPAGLEPRMFTFYEAGGLQGIMGMNGLLERIVGTEGLFPFRPYLHFVYNSLVVVPTCIAFLVQTRMAYDQYLAKALPTLTEEQLSRTTQKLQELHFPAGAVIVRQDELADRFYIVTKGQAEVRWRSPDGSERPVARLGEGQYFGEIGLLREGRRTASVYAATPVTALTLDRVTFEALMEASGSTRGQLDLLIAARLGGLDAREAPASAD
jgi:hypothetical protein